MTTRRGTCYYCEWCAVDGNAAKSVLLLLFFFYSGEEEGGDDGIVSGLLFYSLPELV